MPDQAGSQGQNQVRRALLTGGAGFIGSHVADTLLRDNWELTVVDNFDPFYDHRIKRQNVHAHIENRSYHLIEADIRNCEELKDKLDGNYDVILHLAAKAGVRPSIEAPIGYQQTNVGGTQNLLELAKEWGVNQFIFASSSSVYGVNARVPWRESDSVLMPISPYASTKVSGELMGHVYSHLYGIRFIALRLFTVYGPRQRPDLAIHKFAESMLRGAPITLYGDGTTCRDYTYVADIVSGVRSAIDYRSTAFEIFNLSNERTVTLLELVRALEKVLSIEAKIEWQAEQLGDVPQTCGDISKARDTLGYAPQTDLTAGLTRFAEWLKRTRESA